jgi:transposase-like protein
MAKSLDEQVEAFRSRPLDAGPYTFLCLDALTQKVREHGRTVIVHALIAVGVTVDGQREVLGLDVVSGEDGAGWRVPGGDPRWRPAGPDVAAGASRGSAAATGSVRRL